MTYNGNGEIIATSSDVGTSVTPSKSYFVKHFRWIKAAAAGDSCVIADDAGNVIFESQADGQYFIDVHPFYKFTNGIHITTLDSGTLYVYLA